MHGLEQQPLHNLHDVQIFLSPLVEVPGRLLQPSDGSLLLQVSSLLLVDMPGAEKLLVDPEVLRLHEGSQLSKSLLGLGCPAAALSGAAWGAAACGV